MPHSLTPMVIKCHCLLPSSFLIYDLALNMHGIFAWNMHGIFAWNMHGICMEYAWNMHGICAWNMHGICMEYLLLYVKQTTIKIK